MNTLKIPEIRLPAGDNSNANGEKIQGPVNLQPQPLLLVPGSSIPRRRHSWICGG
ncbi:GSCOCG00002123001-RA-CDS [Cotesia congregata]|nr:GSCOCG00002123001-RA-CDS [Cotesia congregata]